MSIQVYNTLNKKVEEFKPIEDKIVKMYSCGPTVYNYAHIGNFRSYIFSDLLRRFLKYQGYKVVQVMNITDVDDKTIKMSNEKKIPLKEYTEKYTKAFFDDLDTLGIDKAEHYPHATDHINEMIEIIKKLDENGYVYQSEGSTYFRIANFNEYGKLSKIDLEGMKDGVRIDSDEYSKDNVKDFVLWKASKESEPVWDTDYGPGRPGWHIECSAMSTKYLGDTLDIHTGGVDLIFPHHENEIAQTEAATGRQFVRYWIHCAHLIVDGEKMSKSKGNYYTLRDLLDQGHDPKTIRYLLLSTHYRKQLNFTNEGLQSADSAVNRLQNFYNNLKELKLSNNTDHQFQDIIKEKVDQFNKNLEDDLNISGALGYLFELITEANKYIDQNKLTQQDKQSLLDQLNKVNQILNIIEDQDKGVLPEEIDELIAKRQEARKNKDFTLADQIRDDLQKKSIILEDTKDGVKWKIMK